MSYQAELHHYLSDPLLRDYFLSLPGGVRERLLNAGLSLCTLGELQKWGEYYKNDPSCP